MSAGLKVIRCGPSGLFGLEFFSGVVSKSSSSVDIRGGLDPVTAVGCFKDSLAYSAGLICTRLLKFRELFRRGSSLSSNFLMGSSPDFSSVLDLS